MLVAVLQGDAGTGFRSAPLMVPSAGRAGFTELAPTTTGIFWTNGISQEQVAGHYNMVSGGGVAAGNFDGDGWCDLYFCNRGGENALFRNLGGWRFQNVTVAAGVACPDASSTGACSADVNGDGRPDLLVSSFLGPNACFLNVGDGRFTNVTPSAGLLSRGGATSLALGDTDGDGDLDLYAGYFGIESILREGGRISFQMVGGQPVVTGRHARRLGATDDREAVPRNALYWNRGDGTSAEIAWFAGVEASDWSWTPIFLDVDLDGYEDLLVSTGSLYDVMDRDAAAVAKRSGPAGADPRKLLSLYPLLDNRNAAFRNRGELTFEDVSQVWGFDSRQVCQGMALAGRGGPGVESPPPNSHREPRKWNSIRRVT